jgi:Alr-MurF fusion protein
LNYSIEQIQQIVGGEFLIRQNSPDTIEHLLIDSRKLLFPASTLFFAVNGPRRKGIAFVNELYNKGVCNFIVDEKIEIPLYKNANIIIVKDVINALQLLAGYHRNIFSIPVIGITGSNGKTIVKEWLYQLLHNDHTIARSPKSYNSQIGVPLSVWELNSKHDLAIFEAGISTTGEMENLEKIIHPTVGIFTNIGEAHSEGFVSQKEKILEKCKLFKYCQLFIYQKEIFDTLEKEGINIHALFVQNINLFSWSKISEATLSIKKIIKEKGISHISASYKNNPAEISLPFVDDASIDNAISCWCYLLQQGYSKDIISQRMMQLKPVAMRLEMKQGINNCSVINDSYSADMNSLAIALDFLEQQKQHLKRTVILSDLLQSGKDAGSLYSDIAKIIQQKNINRIIGIGKEISAHRNIFKNIPEYFFFNSTDEFLAQFHLIHFNNETVLLKGARIFEFEQIAKLLEQKRHETILEINLNALTHNLKIYQGQLQPGTKLMAIVKAFSYGSGSFEVANLLQFQKIDYLAVAYTDEGVELRKAGITLPIMVMNAEESTYDLLVKYNLEPEIFSFGIFDSFENYLKLSAIQYFPVHLKLDTGMHRLGFENKDMDQLVRKLKSASSFKIQSVFSHLAASDNKLEDDFTKYQATCFIQNCEQISKVISYPFLKHIANTSAIHRHKDLQMDMTRLGIGLYGVDADKEMQMQLKNVTTLKTTIAQIKNIPAGESVGYNRNSIAKEDITIATVRIGYADGYPRKFGNGIGKMLLKGKLVPVIGNVCMDMTMLNITGLKAEEGDEVIVFGEDLPVSKVAEWADTIPYEILTGVSQRVKRIYYEE